MQNAEADAYSRYIYPQELHRLAEGAGFELEGMFSDWQRSSQTIIIPISE